jgi:hypothetical protein
LVCRNPNAGPSVEPRTRGGAAPDSASEEDAMAKRLGPLEVNCDAPPYSIVRACRRIGIHSPEDVRWFRLSQYLNQQPGWQDLLHGQKWKAFLGLNRTGETACSCGHKLPGLEKATFTFNTGREVSYYVGQCLRCRTIFWEDA